MPPAASAAAAQKILRNVERREDALRTSLERHKKTLKALKKSAAKHRDTVKSPKADLEEVVKPQSTDGLGVARVSE
jgi:hypothetical protein